MPRVQGTPTNIHINLICDFLLVINSNLGPILPRFRIAGYLLRRAPSLLFYPNFRGVPLGLDCRCCGSLEGAKTKLIIRVINFKLVQPICSRYLNVRTDRQTDRQTDGRTDGRLMIAILRSALRASRGKNCDPGDHILIHPTFQNR